MFDRLRRFLRTLFGGGEAADAPMPQTGQAPPTPHPQGSPDPAPAAQATTAPGTLLLRLRRESTRSSDTLGTLYLDQEPLALTLEGPIQGHPAETSRLAPGTYALSLYAQGGRHSTYRFRFGAAHHGMLRLDTDARPYPICLLMGYDARHLYGSIVLGQRLAATPDRPDAPRRLHGSEMTYQRVYQRIAAHLRDDRPVQLLIEA